MTAHALKGDDERCREAGMDDYVTKPLSTKRVAEALDRVRATASPGPADHGSAPDTPDASRISRPKADGTSAPRPIPASAPGVIDLEDLLRRCVNKPSIAARVLGKFRDSAQGLMDEIKRALSQEDTDSAARAAHTLKGASGNISAESVYELARVLEQQCRAGAEAASNSTVLALEAELAVCLDRLPDVLEQLNSLTEAREKNP